MELDKSGDVWVQRFGIPAGAKGDKGEFIEEDVFLSINGTLCTVNQIQDYSATKDRVYIVGEHLALLASEDFDPPQDCGECGL